MNYLKIDETKLDKHIETFFEQNGKNPYLICSEKTFNLLPRYHSVRASDPQIVSKGQIALINTVSFSKYPESITIDDKKYISANDDSNKTWKQCKVFIDNELEDGEIKVLM